MVKIYLNIDGAHVSFLSIPIDDIKRLSLKPLKWLRFVTFAICGAHGHLSETAGGPAVNHDTASFDDLADSYYYFFEGVLKLVDINGVNDQITTSSQTVCRAKFRSDIKQRDGEYCVISRESARICDAAHIIPYSKGDEYINKVIKDRSILYNPTEGLENLGINAVENGLLMSKNLHSMFADGRIAFLRTPNFALDPVDIPRVEEGPTPTDRITMQYLKPSEALDPIRSRDAYFRGTGRSRPPAVLLDYMYGVVAYLRWHDGPDVQVMMEKYFTEHYESIQKTIFPPDPSELDDQNDSDYESPRHVSHMWDKMLQGMDEMNFCIMNLKGITPEIWAAQQRRKVEDERDASRKKVIDWMNTYQPLGKTC